MVYRNKMMKSAIPSLFRQVEHEYDVRILLAAGYGSRTIVRGIGLIPFYCNKNKWDVKDFWSSRQ